jgi:hypothetical protein
MPKKPKCADPKCKTCPNTIAPRTGAKGFCPTCYQRERRAAAGVGTLRAGEKVKASPLTKPGARELRALCSPELVKAFEVEAKSRDMSEADLVREALHTFAFEVYPVGCTTRRAKIKAGMAGIRIHPGNKAGG